MLMKGPKGKRSLRYPQDRINYDTPFLKIDAYNKVPSKLGTSLISNGGAIQESNSSYAAALSSLTSTKRVNLRTWHMPLPLGIEDKNGARWGESEFNKLEQFITATGLDVMNSEGARDALDKLFDAFSNGGDALQNPALNQALRTQIMKEILKGFGSKTGGNLLSRTTGKVINPYLELLFEGPQLRDFSFAFEMNPRSQMENQECKRIINAFKYHMSPDTSTIYGAEGWFVDSPDVFDLEFRLGNQKHPYLNSFKTCALTDVSVNYTSPSQQSSPFYEDGGPVGYQLNLSFRELEPVYKTDYESDGFDDPLLEDGVGY